MSNYSHRSCPVPFKVGSIWEGSKDGKTYENENELVGLTGLDLIAAIEQMLGCGYNLSNAGRIVNGWQFKKAANYCHEYKNHGMKVYVDILTKDDNTIYLIDEGEYPDCGRTYLSIFADSEEPLLNFMSDFGIYEEIKTTTYVEQTI